MKFIGNSYFGEEGKGLKESLCRSISDEADKASLSDVAYYCKAAADAVAFWLQESALCDTIFADRKGENTDMDVQPERLFRKKEIIYRQNDYETWMYDILYGSVALYQNYGAEGQVLVKELNDGCFGEMELIEAIATEYGADRERIRQEIITMPNYFDEYDTTVTFISMEENTIQLFTIDKCGKEG